MSKDLFEIRRYELKYTITEQMASEIRDYIKNICSMDKNVPKGDKGYIVNNLYFDTYDLKFYHDTKFKKMNRYKARARFYGEKAVDFIWPEIKYKIDSVVWKKRYNIPIKEWPALFNQENITFTQPLIKKQLDTFDNIVYWHDAQSILHVRYFREPYVSEIEEYARVTFDRQLCCRRTNGNISLEYNEQDMFYYDDPVTTKHIDSPVILEIKVENHVPYWAIEMIRKFNLMQRGFSKYCYGIDSMLGYLDINRISQFSYAKEQQLY